MLAAGALGPVPTALGRAAGAGDSAATVLNAVVTAEELAVTYLTGLVENASATGVTKVRRRAEGRQRRGVRPLQGAEEARRQAADDEVLIPDGFFKPGQVFPTIEVAETLLINAYLLGITTFAKAGRADHARYAGEVLGVEAEHRALARLAQSKLPDNAGFEDYTLQSLAAIVQALEKAGVGFGKKGTAAGKFYKFKAPPASAVVDLLHPTQQ